MSSNSQVYTLGSGSASLSAFVPVTHGRAPTSTDVQGPNGPFSIGQQWVDSASASVYYLVSLSTVGGSLSAVWSNLSAGGAGGVDTLSGNSGSASPTGGNIAVVGTGSVSVTASGSTLTISDTSPAAVDTLTGNTGGAISPITGNIDVVGSGSISVAGSAGTLTISTSLTAGIETITGTTGGPISPIGGNVDLFAGAPLTVTGSGNFLTVTPTTSIYPVSPYIVGPVGQAPYQTVQAAINAASGAGGGTVWIQPGTYTENLTLANNVTLVGSGTFHISSVTIIGTHTPVTGSGMMMSFENLRLASSSGSVISSAAAGQASFSFNAVETGAFNGYLLDIVNWTGAATVYFANCCTAGPAGGTGDGVLNAPNLSPNFNNCFDLGYETTFPLTIGGGEFSNCYVLCALVVDGPFLFVVNSAFQSGVTINGGFAHFYNSSFFSEPGTPALSYASTSSSNSEFMNCIFFTTNDPAISLFGSPNLIITGAEFPLNSFIQGSQTGVTWGTSRTGDTAIVGSQTGRVSANVTSGASPYTVADNDFYIACDSSGGPITILLPSPAILGRHLIIADVTGSAAANNITVVGGSFDIAAGGTTSLHQAIANNYTSYDLTFTNNSGLLWVDNESAALVNNKFPVSPYVVGVAGEASYATVQSAINAASGAGGGTVWIQPGTYTENLTLANNVTLVGSGTFHMPSVTIIGTHTPVTGAGMTMGFENLRLASSSGSVISSAAAGQASFSFNAVETGAFNGYFLDIVNWTGAATIDFANCCTAGPGGGTADGVLNAPNLSPNFNNCFDLGYGSAFPLTTGGGEFSNSYVLCALVSNAAFLFIVNSAFQSGVSITGGFGHFYNSSFFSQSGTPALSYSSTSGTNSEFMNCVFFTANNPAVALTGSPFIVFTGVDFADNSVISGSLTNVTFGDSKTGNEELYGNLSLITAGGKVNVATGANASAGVATLVGGTVTVSTTAVTASSLIFLVHQNTSGTLGNLYKGTVVAATSFIINSDNVADTSDVAWWIIN